MSLRWIITYNRNARKIALIHHYRGSHFLDFSHLWEKRRETLFQWRVSFLYTVRYFGIAKLAKSCYCCHVLFCESWSFGMNLLFAFIFVVLHLLILQWNLHRIFVTIYILNTAHAFRPDEWNKSLSKLCCCIVMRKGLTASIFHWSREQRQLTL